MYRGGFRYHRLVILALCFVDRDSSVGRSIEGSRGLGVAEVRGEKGGGGNGRGFSERGFELDRGIGTSDHRRG